MSKQCNCLKNKHFFHASNFLFSKFQPIRDCNTSDFAPTETSAFAREVAEEVAMALTEFAEEAIDHLSIEEKK